MSLVHYRAFSDSSIGGVAALQEHGVIIFASNIIWLNKGIWSEGGADIFTKRANQNRRHGEKCRCLIKVVHDSKFIETAHP